VPPCLTSWQAEDRPGNCLSGTCSQQQQRATAKAGSTAASSKKCKAFASQTTVITPHWLCVMSIFNAAAAVAIGCRLLVQQTSSIPCQHAVDGLALTVTIASSALRPSWQAESLTGRCLAPQSCKPRNGALQTKPCVSQTETLSTILLFYRLKVCWQPLL
jgi:hypothetical protein